jgi:hypothetical protein
MGDQDFSRIKSLKDEFDYWNSLASKYDLKPEITDRASLFAEQFKPLSKGKCIRRL